MTIEIELYFIWLLEVVFDDFEANHSQVDLF